MIRARSRMPMHGSYERDTPPSETSARINERDTPASETSARINERDAPASETSARVNERDAPPSETRRRIMADRYARERRRPPRGNIAPIPPRRHPRPL